MMVRYSKYDPSGRILWNGVMPETQLEVQEDQIVIGHADPDTEYVLGRTIVPRPLFPAVLTGTTLSGLPVPCTLTVNGQDYAVAEETVTLDFPNPGNYEIRVACWPYLDANFSVRT